MPARLVVGKSLLSALEPGISLAEIGFALVELLLTLGVRELLVLAPARLLGSEFVLQPLEISSLLVKLGFSRSDFISML